jgi:hypothetical protein
MFLRKFRRLVDRSGHFIAAQGGDHALYVPPMAEARDIAVVAAPFRARRRFESGIVTETVDEVGSIGERQAAMDERTVHSGRLTKRRFATADERRQCDANHDVTVRCVDRHYP